jgi:hypothetical protein
MTLFNARSNASVLSSTSTSRAISINRLNCLGLSGFGLGLRGIAKLYGKVARNVE